MTNQSAQEFQLRINMQEAIAFSPTGINPEETGSTVPETVVETTLSTASGVEVPVIWYQRKSNTIIIAAQSLPASKESMRFLAKMFPRYDIVMFDYCWNQHYGRFVAKSFFTGSLIKKVLLDEEQELAAVIEHVLQDHAYTKVIGFGQCYSCYHLAKIQSDAINRTGSGPFTHLIFDSCWHSLWSFIERICTDPLLPANPRYGGAPCVLKWITDNWLFKKIILGTTFACTDDVSPVTYLPSVTVPVLFIHGRNDLFVPVEHFERIWSATDEHNRIALLTPFEHVHNLGNKGVYQHVIYQFITRNWPFSYQEASQAIMRNLDPE